MRTSIHGQPSRHRRLSSIAPLVAALCLAAPAASDRLDVESFRLDNGMTFLLVERPQSPTVAAGWVVSSGSADDPERLSGMAHMLEHLLFKGTSTIRPGEIDLLYANAGATGLNALTQRDLTAYFVSLPAEKLELWFWLESDRLLAPTFAELDAERDVILEERRLRVDSVPTGELEEELDRRLWGNHPYGRPISGDPGQLDEIRTAAVRRFFRSNYGPDRLTAVLVGSFEPAAVRQLAELYFGRLGAPAAGEAPSSPTAPEELSGDTLVGHCECRTQARLIYRGLPIGDPDTVATDVLVSILNGRSGRLHTSLVLEREIAFAAFARHEALRQGGSLSLIAEAKEGTDASTLVEALDAEITRLLARPPDERELAKAKTRLKADGIRALEEPSQLMLRLLIQAGLGEPDQLGTWASRIDRVRAEDVQRVARDLLVDAERVVGLFSRGDPVRRESP